MGSENHTYCELNVNELINDERLRVEGEERRFEGRKARVEGRRLKIRFTVQHKPNVKDLSGFFLLF